MEPDLDRLLDFESHGALFPQFKGAWEEVFGAAHGVADSIRAEFVGRKRVAVNTAEPLHFAALFLALAREEIDLFLFNPAWGTTEADEANRIARPHFRADGFAQSKFEYTRFEDAPVENGLEMGRNKLRVMIPTGGSSGRIRFAIHDWSTLAAATYGFQQHMNCGRLSAHCLLPLYHVSGFMQLARALLSMGCVVFGRIGAFAESHRLLEGSQGGDRFVSLVATQLERLMRDEAVPELLRQYRAVLVGGGPVPAGLLERCRELKVPLAPTYGMTETAAQVATLLPEAFAKGETSQGKALPHARISIAREEDPDEVLPPGEIGLIRVSGRSLFRGYVGESGPGNELSIVTTDLGSLDSRGYLTVLGRADRVVITGGEKVSLREVEIALEKSQLVRDVVAFGVADNEWGEKLAVAFVPQSDLVGEGALREFLLREIANFKIPKIWIRKGEIPRNEAGKPIMSELKSELA